MGYYDHRTWCYFQVHHIQRWKCADVNRTKQEAAQIRNQEQPAATTTLPETMPLFTEANGPHHYTIVEQFFSFSLVELPLLVYYWTLSKMEILTNLYRVVFLTYA